MLNIPTRCRIEAVDAQITAQQRSALVLPTKPLTPGGRQGAPNRSLEKLTEQAVEQPRQPDKPEVLTAIRRNCSPTILIDD